MTGGEHDLISFDPRGTGSTLPFSCQQVLKTRDARLDVPTEENLKSHKTGIPCWNEIWANAEAVGEQCSRAMAHHGSLVGTTFVARDMMRIVDALDEDGLLRYWGLFYGTVLGATAAAMYPDRMDKIVLDGVVNLDQYWSGESVSSRSL